VLTSTPEIATRKFMLGVEVRQRDGMLTLDEPVPAASASTDEQLLDDPTVAEGLLGVTSSGPMHGAPDAATGGASAQEIEDSDIRDKLQVLLQSGSLQDRRLVMHASPYGFEMMSGGDAHQVLEHATRSILYAKLHGLETVFAVHFKVQREGSRPVSFPEWPSMGSEYKQVIP